MYINIALNCLSNHFERAKEDAIVDLRTFMKINFQRRTIRVKK